MGFNNWVLRGLSVYYLVNGLGALLFPSVVASNTFVRPYNMLTPTNEPLIRGMGALLIQGGLAMCGAACSKRSEWLDTHIGVAKLFGAMASLYFACLPHISGWPMLLSFFIHLFSGMCFAVQGIKDLLKRTPVGRDIVSTAEQYTSQAKEGVSHLAHRAQEAASQMAHQGQQQMHQAQQQLGQQTHQGDTSGLTHRSGTTGQSYLESAKQGIGEAAHKVGDMARQGGDMPHQAGHHIQSQEPAQVRR